MHFSGEYGSSGSTMGWRVQGLGWQGGMRAAVAFALCVLMVDQPLMASNTDKRGPTAQAAKESKGEGRVLRTRAGSADLRAAAG